MNQDSSSIRDLAYAIHMTECQRKCGIRNRELRIMMDLAWNFSELFDLPAKRIAELANHCLNDTVTDPGNQFQTSSRRNTRPTSSAQPSAPRGDEFIRLLLDRFNLENAFTQAQAAAEKKIYPLALGDPRYPDRLKSVDSGPAILYVRGNLLETALKRPLWATIIGTRTPTVYGQRVTQMITRDLAARGTVIVSGLARGIDTLAHESALDQNGLTVAVTGCGLDLAYPPENDRLMHRIAEYGALVSEHPPGVEPRRQFFPARNRILSGLSDVVAVMEAAQKSGTLITAGFAGDQGRDVFAVPGNILEQASSGCHQLIRDGAKLLEHASDILREHPVRFVQELLVPLNCQPGQSNTGTRLSHGTGIRKEPVKGDGPLPLPDLNEKLSLNAKLAENILQILRGQALTLDQIAEMSGQAVRDVITATSFLELGGLIVCQRGRYALTASGQCSI